MQKVALELFGESRRVEGRAIAERSGEVAEPEYWIDLCPEMTIGGKAGFGTPDEARVDPEAFRRHGYFIKSDVLPDARTAAILEAIERLRAHDWHALFAFVFDELWALAWASPVRSIAVALLGAPVRLRPLLAVHYVDGEGSPRGWAPHTDGPPFDDRLSTWVPLTDATLDNGCMYIVPRSDEVGDAVTRFRKSETTDADATTLLQHARALPAPAGSVLGWGFDALHWGSARTAAAPPRVSVAYEWLGPKGSPTEGDMPLIDLADGLPPLGQRLELIAWAILAYYGFDRTLLPFVELAKQLRDRAPAGPWEAPNFPT